jgi:hypothetical protein
MQFLRIPAAVAYQLTTSRSPRNFSRLCKTVSRSKHAAVGFKMWATEF